MNNFFKSIFNKKPTLSKKKELINEQTSPLFRMMAAYNIEEPARRKFSHNMCAFHIGKGIILSVAHNLRVENKTLSSIDDGIYSSEILPHLNPVQTEIFNRCYSLDTQTRKRYINSTDQSDVGAMIDALKQINFDNRLVTLIRRDICKLHLVVQFKGNQFYADAGLTSHFNNNNSFHEPALNRHTFLLELELIEACYSEDLALYRIVNTNQDIINRLPSLEVDFRILENNQIDFYCIQSSPNSSVGRLLNVAQIEGFLEHHGRIIDAVDGNYTLEGMRYLIKGYFRFGSSGAPYVFYDSKTKKFKVNAVQSEACPIQLSIDNKKKGNFQYINAIASPLSMIEDKIQQHISG